MPSGPVGIAHLGGWAWRGKMSPFISIKTRRGHYSREESAKFFVPHESRNSRIAWFAVFLPVRGRWSATGQKHWATGEGFYGFINAFLARGSRTGDNSSSISGFYSLTNEDPPPLLSATDRRVSSSHPTPLLEFPLPHFLQCVLSSYISIPITWPSLLSPPSAVAILPARMLIWRQYTASKACKMVVLTVCKRSYTCSVRRNITHSAPVDSLPLLMLRSCFFSSSFSSTLSPPPSPSHLSLPPQKDDQSVGPCVDAMLLMLMSCCIQPH